MYEKLYDSDSNRNVNVKKVVVKKVTSSKSPLTLKGRDFFVALHFLLRMG